MASGQSGCILLLLIRFASILSPAARKNWFRSGSRFPTKAFRGAVNLGSLRLVAVVIMAEIILMMICHAGPFDCACNHIAQYACACTTLSICL